MSEVARRAGHASLCVRGALGILPALLAAAGVSALLALGLADPAGADSGSTQTGWSRTEVRPVNGASARTAGAGQLAVQIHGHRGKPSGPRLRALGPATSSRLGLPAQWCGDPIGPAELRSQASGTRRFQVIYVHPADRPDRHAATASAVQRAFAGAASAVEHASGTTQSLRPALGTSCGPRHLTLGRVQLAHSASHYTSGSARERWARVIGEVRSAASLSGDPRNLLIVADGLDSQSWPHGEAELPLDNRAGSANASNRGGYATAIWANDEVLSDADYLASLTLHELTHMLGAVQHPAPNATGTGHCTDRADVLCYDDGGPFAHLLRDACTPAGPLGVRLDCNGDDYYNPAPAPGSYLDRHWNVADSSFLCGLEECGAPALLPRAHLQAPSTAGEGRRLRLDASGSTIEEGTISGFEWDLDGDGSFEKAGGPTIRHAFERTTRVSVRVASDAGIATTTSAVIRVIRRPAMTLRRTRAAQRRATVLRHGFLIDARSLRASGVRVRSAVRAGGRTIRLHTRTFWSRGSGVGVARGRVRLHNRARRVLRSSSSARLIVVVAARGPGGWTRSKGSIRLR